ncbi:DUF1467 family protein [Roseomonas sp. CCTCC AB2023176]|uniref:DUF1467 family protein n=1 Tax=Roseomonas sp. CCTCC AB2023176 TaxID=3342640 RepID=UPI0035DC4463
MTWISGTLVFVLIWWTALFAVLPIGIRPDPAGKAPGGWRGAPTRVRIARILLLNTLLTAVLWFLAYWLISSDWLSFRSGWMAMPND